MKKRIVILLIAASICLTGCVEKKIVDEINIAIAAGFDSGDEKDKFKTTFLMQDFMKDMSVQNRTITTEGNLRREVLSDAHKQSPAPVVVGGMRLTLYEKSLAETGLGEYVDTYQRDASIGTRIYFATTEGKTEDALKADYGLQGNGSFISDMIEHNIRQGDVPKTNLAVFLHDYYQQGKDVYLPHLKKIDDQNIDIAGLMLFKDAKALFVLPSEKLFYFKLLVDQYSKGDFTVTLDNSEKASIHSIISKHKFKIEKKDPTHLTINIKVKGNIKEYTGHSLSPSRIKEISKELENKVEKECYELVEKFKEENIDPVGFGAFYKTKIRHFDFEKWKESYGDLTVDVNCDAAILETGAIY
ncbi:Ger(x)C family spore germination protein [Cytobacillus purgationiresistens]|uniref:Spore germination protein n=1 Tax=Cytobacillus purgationiresistens TaxID=863449 RepID=A0ABU0APR1_9BACI|nr:Ger(x)C family spore germination protein [Cytobacillus purgationiresistens]MDQ0273015.1 spore germination protein [Cytobacillus purgationiresistens]